MTEILARRSLRKEHLSKPQDKKNVPAKQHGIWREICKLKVEDKATFYSVVTMQFLDETPAVLSLGKLCSEHGCSYELKNGETPRLTKMGRQLLV